MAVAWGAGGCIWLTGYADQLGVQTVVHLLGVQDGRAWAPALVAPVVEEPFKALAVVVLTVSSWAGVRSPLQAMVLGSLAGMGFQLIENLRYEVRAARIGQLHAALGVSVQRSVEGVVLSLWMFSACTGLAVGLLLAGGRRSRACRYAEAGALVAAALAAHAPADAFPGLSLAVGPVAPATSQVVIAVGLFVGFLAIVRGARRGVPRKHPRVLSAGEVRLPDRRGAGRRGRPSWRRGRRGRGRGTRSWA